jgi:hypothetical protein
MNSIDATISELLQPKIGDYLIADGWSGIGSNLQAGDPYVDGDYRGAQFRVTFQQHTDRSAAINVTVTGRKSDRDGFYRCRIEFVGDGEQSIFTKGKVLIR